MPQSSPEEEHLRASLDRARFALAHMQRVAKLGSWERDEVSGVVDWSLGLKELLGVDPGPEAWLDLLHPDDRPRVMETILSGLKEDDYRYETRATLHGEERLLHIDALVERAQDGTPLRTSGIVQDITDWQRSEDALAISEAIQTAVVDSALDCVVVINADGRVIEWNPAAEETFGYSRSDALGQELAELIIPPEHREAHRRALARSDDGDSRVLGRRLEMSALRCDGSEFPVELAIALVPGERPLYAVYLRDITDRQHADEARRTAEYRWRALVEQIPAVTYLARFDDAATMLYMSPQVEQMTGFPAEMWIDDPLFWLSRGHPEDTERASGEARARFEQQRGFSCSYRFRRADEQWIWIDERSTVLYNEEGEPAYLQGVMVDVTERREREKELREAQRLESVGQLAGGVAHDFNNLLGIIQGYAELLETDVPETSRADVLEIRRAAERAADLTRQLLLFGRRSPEEAGVVELNGVVADMSNMMERTLGEHVVFRVDQASEPCPVRIPAGQLEQILVNLTVNARDAMPGGGRLSVSTGANEGRVTLRLTDSGTGMSDDVAARAFDPFFSTKEKARGTGLGLATVYGIVQRAGGRVALHTLPGRGTTVEIELPLTADEPEGTSAPRDLPLAGQGETVLVVEDESAVRELTGRILAENGYQVIHAPDGYRARDLCHEFRGHIHLLLSDVVMPGMSGCEVAEQLRGLRPDLKVLYMSGHAGDVLDHHGFPGGEMHLLEKPFSRDRLLASVRDVLDSVPSQRSQPS